MRARPGAHRPPAGEERPPPPLALSAAGAPRWAAAGPGAGRRAGAPGGPWGCGSAAPRLPAAGAGAGGQVSGGAGGTGAALPPPPPPALPRPRRRARTGGGSPGVSSEKTAPAPPQRAPLPPQLSLWEGAGGTSPPPPPVCPGVGGGWGIADSDGKGGGLPLEGGLREGQRRWDAKGKSAARKRGLRGGLGLCFLFALKWWKFGDALARCLHRLRCPSGLMRVVLVWQEGQVAFVGVPEEDCSAAVV